MIICRVQMEVQGILKCALLFSNGRKWYLISFQTLWASFTNERTTEIWAYGRFYAKLGIINMDVSGGYDQISRQV